MKKILLMAAAIATLTGCTNDLDQIEKQETEYGTILLNMGADTDVALTRALQTVSDFSNWDVQIKKGNDIKVNWKSYDSYVSSDWKLPVDASNPYTINVRTKEYESNTAGYAIYEGSKNQFVSAATNYDVTVACGTQKTSQVAVQFTSAFISAFSNYTIAVTDANVTDRTFTTTTSTATGEALAYLLPDGDTKAGVTYRLIGTLNNQSGQKVLAQITEPIRIEPATKLVLNVDASTDNGKITLTITYDDEVAETTKTITIDPTEWNSFESVSNQ